MMTMQCVQIASDGPSVGRTIKKLLESGGSLADCKARGRWNPTGREREIEREIRKSEGDRRGVVMKIKKGGCR